MRHITNRYTLCEIRNLLANKQQTDDFITIMSRASIEAGKVQKDVLRFIAKRAGELRHAHADHQATVATDSALNDALRNSDS